MKLLLDTHTFLWWLSSPDQLTEEAADVIGDLANDVHVSVITLWRSQLSEPLENFAHR